MVKSECVHSPKPSFTFYAWKRLKTVIAAVKQTNLKVKRLRGEVEEKLQARSSLTELLAEVQTKQADLVLLEDFLKREKNRMCNRNRRLTEANKSVELMEKALTRLSTEIEKDRALYYEKMQEYVALREQLLWVNAQLMIRRKNMTGQLASIFYPQQSVNDILFDTSSSNCTCESVYRIAGLHLPDAENYRSQSQLIQSDCCCCCYLSCCFVRLLEHCYLEISSALGYVALLIIILSSIFDVPLSHEVKFAGSRSVIFDFSLQNSNNTIQTFPLYTSRSNKITFNYGVFLLNRNIAQIFFFFCTGPIMFGHSTGMLRWSSLLLTIVVILLYSRSTDSIRWLALGQSNKLWNHAQHCPRTRFERKRYGLAGVQTRLCKRHADLMPIIMKSASQSVMVCQQQFKNYRWNCSSVRQVPKLPPDLTKGTREQALVYALSAAAVAHGIAKACSSGTIAYCPCGNAVSGAKFDDYIRRGCSDNVPYGQKIINHMLELKCKCHGVSGSCNLKTCWKVLPPLIQIGEMLRKKYSRAAEVRWLNGGNSARYNVEPYALVGRVTEDDLVYIRKSPDYCTEDRRVGSIGTQGRTCNATEQSSAGCDSMCCGRGHEIVFEYVISNCRCRYVHCCYVECDRCRELAEKHVCK
ncbi:protein Wnt-11 [Trichinella spiralis]|uniref:protein Wnt-11 n=1 Tax=Trichinella spiralis TaxID=6334 RepID=UPI0001EFBF12|nr:protein Wnt-11 [Trichinella spiralis]